MPSVYLFHRKSILAGDDLQPAAVVSVGVRLVQLTLFLGPILWHIRCESRQAGGFFNYVLYDRNHDAICRNTHFFPLLLCCYVFSSVAYNVAATILEWRIAGWSSRGVPTQTEPRNSQVAHLLELKLVPYSIILFLIWCTGLSAVSLIHDYNRCSRAISSIAAATDYDDDDKSSISIAMEWNFPVRMRYWWVGLIFLMITQAAEVAVSWIYLIHLCRVPVINRDVPWEESERNFLQNHELVEEMWASRCTAVCQCLSVTSCFMFGGRELLVRNADFGHVARALADYFETRGVLDVAPSDIAMGLIILQRLQRLRVYEARNQVLGGIVSPNSMEEGEPLTSTGVKVTENSSAEAVDQLLMPLDQQSEHRHFIMKVDSQGLYHEKTRQILDRRKFEDMAALEEGARYAKYALAIYTWVLYLYTHPVAGAARLIAASACNACVTCCGTNHRRRLSPVGPARLVTGLLNEFGCIEGDNCCQTNKHALLLTAGLEESELIYAQLKSGFADNPYCILLDHEWRNVVIAVRGTFSLEDCVTDVLIEPESLEQLGIDFGFNAEGQYCHGGVMACVRNVYRDLQRHGLLEQLLLGENALYPDYNLLLVGHSLGAATCTLLSYMLRPRFPTLRCLNYCPVGCTLTWELATGCHEWCKSFVLDSDLVPRLSIDAMERMRDEVLDLIGRVKVPKIDVVRQAVNRTAMWSAKLFNDEEIDNIDDLRASISETLCGPNQVPDTEYHQQLSRFKAIQEERRQSRQARSVKLYPPGRIMHLLKTGETKSCLHGVMKCLTCCTTNVGFRYTPIWIKNDDLNEIVVTTTMGTDHFPNRITSILENVAAQYGIVR